MSRTIVVCGHGPGISNALAHRFGKEGFQVALVARSADRLEAAARTLADAGVVARAFPCDLADPASVQRLIADVRTQLGPITVVHWNAYTGGAGDLTTSSADELRRVFDLSTTSMIAAVQGALPDLREHPEAAVLVTGGGLSYYNPAVDEMAVGWNAMGLAIAKASQHKAVGLLHAKLAADGIYVGEVVVLGIVKGTAFDHGNGVLEASQIADRFWSIYRERREVSVEFGR